MNQTDHLRLKRRGFKHVFSSSNKVKRKRGVAVLISGSLNYEHLSETSDEEGRFIRVTGRIEGSEITYPIIVPSLCPCRWRGKTNHSLYDRPSARIKVNGDLSEAFLLNRGCRQGCAISPLLFNLFIETLGQLIRQNQNIKGITLSGTEHKAAMFADDVLVCLGDPENSFSDLMSTLNDFGKLSGYKINILKTQVITLNYTAPSTVRKKFKVNWDNEKIKYLGIHLTRDISRLFQANYVPISLSIKADLPR